MWRCVCNIMLESVVCSRIRCCRRGRHSCAQQQCLRTAAAAAAAAVRGHQPRHNQGGATLHRPGSQPTVPI